MFSIGDIIGAVQGVRETVEGYRDELGSVDLFVASYALQNIEDDLFELWETMEPSPST